MTLRIKGGAAIGIVVAIAVPMGLHFEGVFPVGYRDPVGIPTDCVGETGQGIKVGAQRFTMEQCIARYPPRLQRLWWELDKCMHAEVTMFQGATLLSFADNTGVYATCTSTMARQINAGLDGEIWCHQVKRWNKGTILGVKVVLPGLVRRRLAEFHMCMGRDWRTGEPFVYVVDFSNVRSGVTATAPKINMTGASALGYASVLISADA